MSLSIPNKFYLISSLRRQHSAGNKQGPKFNSVGKTAAFLPRPEASSSQPSVSARNTIRRMLDFMAIINEKKCSELL